ncbi:MAG: dephospho-CoA kinase [Actinomycetota bacterium]|jgi:dephospho-CoA kinase|nr:dephospho-CoA kinase [Actinomycetota bacterium]
MRDVLIGLTGGIGSGKSAVANLFAERGARIVDADKVAREVVAGGSAGLRAVVDEFGAEVLGDDGELDRTRLAHIVFADPQARERLNAIVHPLVADRIEAMLAEQSSVEVVVYDVPLLVEGSVQNRHDFDLILVVEAPEDLRVQRLQRDRNMTEEQVRARMASQATDDQRRAIADVVIVNDGNRTVLSTAVDKVWRERIRPAS